MSEPIFVIRPNWAKRVLERLAWLTDVLESHDATEQRLQVRARPRRILEYDFLVRDAELARLDALLWGYQTQKYLLPIWTDPQVLAAELPAGAVEIVVSTEGYDFEAGGQAVLLRGLEAEAVEIDQVQADRLTLAAPTVSDWSKGARVYPARLARVATQATLRKETNNLASGSLQFDFDPAAIAPAPGATLYRDLEVNLRRPNWINGLPVRHDRKAVLHDHLTGIVQVDDLSGLPRLLHTHRYLLRDRPGIAVWRGWLAARAGRLNAFWQPQWSIDVVQTAGIGAASNELQVRALTYSVSYALESGRRDLAFLDYAGNWYFRRIEGALPAGADNEVLLLDAPLGVDAAPGFFQLITWLMPARLEQDAIEISWQSDGIASSTVGIRSVRE